MKLLILVILVFINVYNIQAQEDVIVNTLEGQKTLIVPETKEELKEAFIEMSIAYINERYDAETISKNSRKLILYQTELLTIIATKEKIIDKLEKELKQNWKFIDLNEKLKGFIVLGPKWSIDTTIGFHGSGGMILFDRFIFSVLLEYPFTAGFGAGMIF